MALTCSASIRDVSAQAAATTAMLRVACDGPAVNAEVTINGEFKGDCPIDVPVAAGSLRIRVMKKVDSERELVFEQEVRMVGGTVKRIDVEFGAPQLNAAAQRAATQRAAVAQAEAERAAAVRTAAAAAAQAEAERAAAVLAAAEAQATAERAAFLAAPGRTFRDCADCPEMVVIPSGSFQMSKYSVVVNINSFAIGRYEVTQGQWKAVMGSSLFRGDNPSYFKDCGETCPVELVSWDDAQEFIQKLNRRTGKIYRLPSESEWEYACRAGADQKYCGSDNVSSVAVYKQNSSNKPQSVGRNQPNHWGLYDMSGNVWEWTQDCFKWKDDVVPSDGSARKAGWGECFGQVIRGGAFTSEASAIGFDVRNRGNKDERNFSIGFRLARIAP